METSRVYILLVGLDSITASRYGTLDGVRAIGSALRDQANLGTEGITTVIEPLVDDHGTPVAPVSSENISSIHWQWIAGQIGRNYSVYDGFVIVHGAETLAYTASALSFMLEGLAKPVVLTWCEMPLDGPRTDAIMSILNAIYIAAYAATGLPNVAEVVVCTLDRILHGDGTRRVSANPFTGFETPNATTLGWIGESIRIDTSQLRESRHQSGPLRVRALESRVVSLQLFPGVETTALKEVLLHSDLKGVVLQIFGSGNVRRDPAFLDVIEEATKAGKVILAVDKLPRSFRNSVDVGMHELVARGVLPGFDLTPEAALAKLMVSLGPVWDGTSPVSELVCSGVVGPNGTPLDLGSHAGRAVLGHVHQVREDLIAFAAAHPQDLPKMDWQQFEELVAELWSRAGYEVALSRRGADEGIDIFAVRRDGFGSVLYLVQCKRQAPDRKVGIDVVQRLVGTVEARKATAGAIATTSSFTIPAIREAQRVQWRLSLHDLADIQRWVRSAYSPPT
ncbi:MAG: L-asparaginase [Acidimicrobiaceae bacterium]|jgi:L-asparaginase|nr:L-asparaginase [Acidimicrobiaceae bacterium]